MGMAALETNLPPIPDLAIAAEVIRRAEAAAAERRDRRPPTDPTYRLDGSHPHFRSMPAREGPVAYLRGLPDEILAGLYALYRVADLHHADPAAAAERYRISCGVAMRPIHRPHGAADLAAKGPLAEGLRRGIELLGLLLEPGLTSSALTREGGPS